MCPARSSANRRASAAVKKSAPRSGRNCGRTCRRCAINSVSTGNARASDTTWLLIVLGTASALVALATTYRDEAHLGVGALCLVLDAAIVGFTTLLVTASLTNGAN